MSICFQIKPSKLDVIFLNITTTYNAIQIELAIRCYVVFHAVSGKIVWVQFKVLNIAEDELLDKNVTLCYIYVLLRSFAMRCTKSSCQ